MSKKQPRRQQLRPRDPLAGLPYGVNALIRNEGSTLEEVPLADIDLADDFWRLRPSDDIDLLIESIDITGQQAPILLRRVEEGARWQIVTGFRRVEALVALQREEVMARLFDQLDDAQALAQVIVDNFFASDLNADDLDAFLDRLDEGLLNQAPVSRLIGWARERLSQRAARQTATSPPPPAPSAPDDAGGEDMAACIDRTFLHLTEAAQGLERIFLNWSDISTADRRMLAAECKYVHDLYPFLTR